MHALGFTRTWKNKIGASFDQGTFSNFLKDHKHKLESPLSKFNGEKFMLSSQNMANMILNSLESVFTCIGA